MLKKLLFYLHWLQRYEFYNVNLLRSTILRKTTAKFLILKQTKLLSNACLLTTVMTLICNKHHLKSIYYISEHLVVIFKIMAENLMCTKEVP